MTSDVHTHVLNIQRAVRSDRNSVPRVVDQITVDQAVRAPQHQVSVGEAGAVAAVRDSAISVDQNSAAPPF